jgi:signal transduction histidine kinase
MEEKCGGPGMGMEMMQKMMEGHGGFMLPMMER